MRTLIMKHIPGALCALFLLATGCIDSTMTVNVKKDGSGTITQEMLISPAASAMMNSAGAGGKNQFNIEEAAARAATTKLGEGVTYVSSEEISSENGSKGSRIVYSFDDVSKISVGGVIDGASGPVKASKEGNEKISFSFKKGKVPTLTIRIPQQEPKAAADAKAEEAQPDPNDPMMAMMMSMMKDLRMRMLVTVEGGPKKTNASFKGDDGTITLMDMGLGKIMSDPVKMKKLQSLGQEQDPMAAAQQLNEFEEVKFETQKEITISF